MEPFRKLISESKILSWIVDKISVHTAISDAHHEPYTDAEVDAILAVHTAIPAAHHLPYTDAMVDAIVATHTAIPAAHHTKYTDAEVDAILAVHTAIPAAHHAKYTDAEAVVAMGVKTDTNPLHHDKLLLDAVHVQNFDIQTISVPSGVVVSLDFDNDSPPFEDAVIEYDYGGLYDDAQSSRITFKKAGLYIVKFRIHWAFNNVGSYRGVYIYKNGGYVTGSSPEPHQSASWYQETSLPMKLAVNDYIEIKLYQDSGNNINVDYGYYYLGLWATMLREV